MSNQSKSQSTATKGPSIIKCEQFNSTRFSYTDLDTKNELNKAQAIAYPRYKYQDGKENNFRFQVAEFVMSNYGLPKIGDYYKDDNARGFVKVPLDQEQDALVNLEKMLQQIDEYNEKNKQNILGGFKNVDKNFRYQPIIREPIDSDELELVEDDSKKTGDRRPRPKYCKFKIDTDYKTGKINTKIFIKDAQDPKKRGEEVAVETVTDLEKYLNYQCHVRMVILANKLYVDKSPKDDGKRRFGNTFKIIQMEITPRESSSVKEEFQKYAFLEESEESVNEKALQEDSPDGDLDDGVETQKPASKVQTNAQSKVTTNVKGQVQTNVQTKKMQVEAQDDDDEEDDDEDEDEAEADAEVEEDDEADEDDDAEEEEEEEPEPEPPKKKAPVRKGATQAPPPKKAPVKTRNARA